MKKKVVISNSMLRTLVNCPTQARLRTDGWGVFKQLEAPLKCGSSCHLAFEQWICGKPTDECVQVFLANYQPYSESFLTETGKQANYWHQNVANILRCFFAANPIQTMPFEVVTAETPIEMLLFEDNEYAYFISDKSDAIVRMKDSGDLFAFENKTTKWIDEDWLLDYALDSQLTTHVAVPRENGFDIKGVFLQVLAVNKLPNPLATTKTGKPQRCRVEGHGFTRDCWTNHVRWERYIATRTDEDLDTWQLNVERLIRLYRDTLIRPLVDVPQTGLFGKCGRCEFLAFCRSQRNNFDLLVKRDREEGVNYSGIYLETN